MAKEDKSMIDYNKLKVAHDIMQTHNKYYCTFEFGWSDKVKFVLYCDESEEPIFISDTIDRIILELHILTEPDQRYEMLTTKGENMNEIIINGEIYVKKNNDDDGLRAAMTKKSSYEYKTLEPHELEGFLPCPWCGEFTEDKQNFLAKITDKQGWKSISCSGCGVNPTFCVHTWDEVVRLWNSRIDFNDSNEYRRGVESYKRHMIDLIKDMEF